MSIIDIAGHSVVTYDGKNKAFTGQRLAKFSWKTDAMGMKRDSKCVSLPLITGELVAANLDALSGHIAGYLHSVQDKMIREQLESRNVSTITAESIDISAICDWLDSNDESGRLTKESVGSWFDSEVSEMLAVTLAERLGVSETPTQSESDKIMATVAAFKGKIAALAGGKTSYEPRVCKSLISALELAPAGDSISTRFIGRLNKMVAAAVADEELLLAL